MASVELRGPDPSGTTAVAVVDNVSLRIEHGRLVCLLGPSGCGKTTTLRLIAGFVEPTAGEIRVGDRVVSSPAAHAAARAAQDVDDLPELRAVAAHDGRRERRLWPHPAQIRPRRHPQEGRGDSRDHEARYTRRPLSGRIVGRPAAARRARPRAHRRARDAAARRAAVQSRRQPARGDALRGAPAARRSTATPRSTSPTTSPRR